MIRSGKHRHKLIFQTPSQASDGLGAGGTITYSDTVTAWAERWSIKGPERVEAARNKQNSIARWHLRYNASIIPSMRIKVSEGGVTHYQQVIAVNPIGNNLSELEVLAEEKI